MIRIFKLIIVLFLAAEHSIYAQSTQQETALKMGREAIRLMDKGQFDESIKLLEEAQQLDPGNINYPYELAYAYYSKKDYQKSRKYLEKILKHKDINPMVYQLLGNSYDHLGKSDKAIATYESGLKLFPDAGNLYLEMGVMQIGKKDYHKALAYYEKGIDVDPSFPSNYYWAAKIYCNSTEEIWGIIYGELFMNMERNSKRTAEISKLLYDTYKSEIHFKSDTSWSVSFSQNITLAIGEDMEPKDIKIPFQLVYEPILVLSMVQVKTIDIHTLNTIRSAFVDNYFSNENDKTHPNILFSYQKKIKDAGHMEAYNYWLLMKGDEAGFDQWYKANRDKWDRFADWFTDNQLIIDRNHKFHRKQY